MTAPTVRARRLLVAALVAGWVVVPVLLMLGQWPQWWVWIAPELTPMTWVQSVALVLAGAGSLVIGYVLRLAGHGRTAIWWVLAAGFAALALDERFALHERVRDNVLAPRGVTIPFLPWIAPGDFLVLLMGLVGLALLPWVWRAVRDDSGARVALVVGVVLASIAVAADSIDPSTWTVTAERFEQTAEEVVELASGLAFLAFVGLYLLRLLGSLAAQDAVRTSDDVRFGTDHPRHSTDDRSQTADQRV